MMGNAMVQKFNQPLGGNEMPRFGGPATMMRLPTERGTDGLDACFVGVPLDIGTSNRSGTRYGPRQIRAESCLIRPYNMATRAAPFDSLHGGRYRRCCDQHLQPAALHRHHHQTLMTTSSPTDAGR